MINKIKNLFFLMIIFIFIFLISKHYFSNENIIFTQKSRSSYTWNLTKVGINLPLLENDTKNIIIYKNDIKEFNKKRKKRFWENLISNEK